MHILIYNTIETDEITGYAKLKKRLEQDDFRSADVKKLKKNLYSARLDRTNRILFSLHTHQQQTYLLLLEYIPNHNYAKSRFLRRGSAIDENKLPTIYSLQDTQAEQHPLTYLQANEKRVQLLDKVISFDASQQAIYRLTPPLILAGSAGSGKSILMLEKMKQLQGRVLYITQSPYLNNSSRKRYYAHQYDNSQQNTQFLCYQELLESIEVPQMKAMTLLTFTQWHNLQLSTTSLKNTQALFEEFRGVITSTPTDSDAAYLSKKEYLSLGIKQSIFLTAERNESYRLFQKYLDYLTHEHFYDINLLSHQYLNKLLPQFDYIVIDEIQDMTTIQVTLILRCLKDTSHIMICGDANQLVQPNFFSWAKIKSLFLQHNNKANNKSNYKHGTGVHETVTRVITSNYRNTPQITALANKVLKLKNQRFGSIDHESHHLMVANQQSSGEVVLLKHTDKTLHALNEKTSHSTDFAVIVLQQVHKKAAKKAFDTPLIFSIQECKGLEYKNIIIYNMISEDVSSFAVLCDNIDPTSLDDSFHYARNKDKYDKSLDTYKFFINSLYVAITRAEKNIYWIESQPSHPLFTLLALSPPEKDTIATIEYQTSNHKTWQEEASRLEAQGNSDQAQQVRQHVLQQTMPTWTIYAGAAINELFVAALEHNDKKAKLALFEYSLVYEDHQARNALISIGFKPAFNPNEGMQTLLKKHFMSYQQDQLPAINRLVKKYGVDYRNSFNQTPLMIAAWLGKTEIIHTLNKLGANPLRANNKGLNAFQIALEQACLHANYAQQHFVANYDVLRPDTLNIRLNKQLIVLSHQHPEFFLVHLIIALFYRILPNQMMFEDGAFNGTNITNAIAHFPAQLLPQNYHDADYIDHVLKRNQPFSYEAESYPLFYPISEGNYLLNPELQLHVEEEWLHIYDILWIDDLALDYQENMTDIDTNALYQNILNMKKKVYKQLIASAMARQNNAP
jgi:hypothetical protein